MKRFLSIFILLIFCCTGAYASKQEKIEIEYGTESSLQSHPPSPELFADMSEKYETASESANVLYAQNDIENSLNALLDIPEMSRTAQNWLLIGNIMQDKGKLDEAVFMYKKASQTDEKYFKAYYNIGNIYLQDGKPNMAIEQYKKVIKLKPDYPYAHYNLGCAYIKLGKYSKAKFELLTAIDLKNTVADFHYNLAYVYKMLGKEKQAQTYLDYYKKLTENNV